MPTKFYLTTPIYYVNGKPSIGHAYTTFVADTIARYQRMLGKEVEFLTGTDENSQKNVEAAAAAGREDDIQGYLDEMAALWQRTFDSLGITNTRFIRTTEADHHKAVEAFWKRVEAKGDIYKGTYEGLYCGKCEAFYTENDLEGGLCPFHKTKPDHIKEDNYFFALTKYRDALLEHIEKNPEFVQPKERRNEIVSYIKNFMTDVSVSRQTMKWGIPVPGDETHRLYVWFDALINYITGVGFATDEKKFDRFWPADLQLVGKDILKFHCALWPAMLMSAGLPLPKVVLAHGFFTVDGQKMSKSLGNVVDPVELSEQYSPDIIRYYAIRDIRLGDDGDFSHDRLRARYETDLANELGNLVHRVLTMTEKYTDAKVPEKAQGEILGAWQEYQQAMTDYRLTDALDIIWAVIRRTNQFIEQQQPWALAKLEEKKMLHDTLYVLLETLRHIAWMLWPFMPDTAEKMFTKLGLEVPKEFSQSVESAWVWGELKPGSGVEKGEPLFPRKE
ncbi:methionine--tRNA ligase [Candidatus Uhrbacteria bacterium]|nr:methionine--tRNA ligase [Candidatus Uhrbacteria bacterium]